MEILRPEASEQLDEVRTLMRAFIDWHHNDHPQDAAVLDRYFDAAAFDEELASLPGKYAPPAGELLLARLDGEPAGCVAMRAMDEPGVCEMKRMFVYTPFHGRGVGRALGEAIVASARQAGYRKMRLDTGFRQAAACALYHALGFRDIPPYYELPDEVSAYLVFMELDL